MTRASGGHDDCLPRMDGRCRLLWHRNSDLDHRSRGVVLGRLILINGSGVPQADIQRSVGNFNRAAFPVFDERQLLGSPIDFPQETGRGGLNGVLGNRFWYRRPVSLVRAQVSEPI